MVLLQDDNIKTKFAGCEISPFESQISKIGYKRLQ